MAWYRAGSISLTNGSTAVVGTGTDFIAGAAVGESVIAPDGKVYEIAAIVSATSLTLGSNYLGTTASGQPYAIAPTQSYIRDLAGQAATLINTYSGLVTNAAAGKFPDGTLSVPSIRFTTDDNTGINHLTADSFDLVTNGASRATVSNTGLLVPTIDINGGTIDGTPIGSVTPSTGAFTTLSATSTVSGAGFTARFATPGPIGNTTASTGAFTTLSTTGNVTLGDASTDTLNVGNGGLIKDASGTVGIGATPAAWISTGKALQLSAWSSVSQSSNGGFNCGFNFYESAANVYTYLSTDQVSRYEAATTGGHNWYSADSGTIGTTITFTQVLSVNKDTTLALQGATSAAGCGIAFPATQVASSNANTLDDYREATYTATATGMTTAPTGSVAFVRAGNIVTMEIPPISGTSNATSFTLTGMPTTCRPSATRVCVVRTQDNGGSVTAAQLSIASDGTMTLYKDTNGTAFTSSGTKAVAQSSFSYII